MPFESGGGGGGGVGAAFKKKYGPLPLWAWMGLGLGGAVIFASWRRNKSASDEADVAEAQYAALTQTDTTDDEPPTYTFVDADRYLITWPEAPPGGGRPPTTPVVPTPPKTSPTNTAPPKIGTAVSTTAAPQPAAKYRAVKGDTLAKIAKKFGVTVAALWKYNTAAHVRAAKDESTIKSRGQSKIVVNSLWYIPPKSYK